MDRIASVGFQFVEIFPRDLVQATLYISTKHRSTSHLCLCGCGEEVIIPLGPSLWSLTFDGATVSLSPSIGNSEIRCRSHYWITKNSVRWYPRLTESQIRFAKGADGWITNNGSEPIADDGGEKAVPRKRNVFARLFLVLRK